MLQKPRGTRDFLPAEMAQRRHIERRMRTIAQSYGYGEIQTPMFEEQELFTLKSGEGIIGEMYAFEDKGGRKIALRPEVTAAVVRAYVNEAQVAPKPLRWYYFAECFRYERPQKGRYRQFWQFGCELIGADSAAADAEVIALAYELLKSSGVRFDLYDPLTTLITAETLDQVWQVTGDIPEKSRIEETFRYLTAQNIPFVQNFGIARGLDYYTGMVFEGFADNLGAENQILGGGVYRLAHLFGGKDVPSCGFAIGFDRVMVSLGEITPDAAPVVAVVATPQTRTAAYTAAAAFRSAGITVVMDVMDRSFGAQISSALKSGAAYAALIGEKEAAAGTVTLKNLEQAAQQEMSLADAVAEVAGHGTC